MLKKSVVCAAVIAAATCIAAPAQADPADSHAGTLALLQRELTQAPGAAVYAGDANGSWNLQVGTGDTSANVPIQPDQHFRIGSQTKTFTAAVVLQLVDEGKVDLNAPIERYLPGVVDGNGYNGNTVTVRDLLQQISGIPSNDTNPHPQQNPDGSYTLANLVKDGLSLKPNSTPGTTFTYSNTNFEILGMLIEQVTGEPVGDAITARIITPLGLTQTTFPKGGDRTLPAPYVHGYYGGTVGGFFFWYDNTGSFEPSLFSSAGGMLSTESDLAKFYQALITGKVVSAASLALMQQTIPMTGAPAGYGYGLGLISHALSCGGVAWGHAGNAPGYASWTAATADGRYATVVANEEYAITGDNGDDLRFEVINSAMCGN
ncbi:MAG TPA: serine hydrolase domain-containing protein [Pseudonocardiaceae bacterium]